MSVVLATGSYFFYKAHVTNYKKDFRSYLSSHSKLLITTVITINKTDLYKNMANIIWEDENQEVVYNNKLYDVIAVKSLEDKVQITVVSDEKEQDLKNQFSGVYGSEFIKKQNNPISLLKQFLALKCTLSDTKLQIITNISLTKNCNIVCQSSISEGYLKQETLPPISS